MSCTHILHNTELIEIGHVDVCPAITLYQHPTLTYKIVKYQMFTRAYINLYYTCWIHNVVLTSHSICCHIISTTCIVS